MIREALIRRPVVLVAAHPDDETIGAGGLLPCLRRPVVVHVTDGAPRKTAGREDYARLRRQELLSALEIAGIGEEQTRTLDVIDQEASLEMASVTRRIAELLAEMRPGAVLTHPYEGGHPDHDATAFAVHVACALQTNPIDIYEYTSYHGQRGGPSPALETGWFLAGQDSGEAVVLTEEAAKCKACMFRCFASQDEMLRQFPIDVERFRRAPAYDFKEPPHPGKLFYENFDWGMNGERWRALAHEAMRAL